MFPILISAQFIYMISLWILIPIILIYWLVSTFTEPPVVRDCALVTETRFGSVRSVTATLHSFFPKNKVRGTIECNDGRLTHNVQLPLWYCPDQRGGDRAVLAPVVADLCAGDDWLAQQAEHLIVGSDGVPLVFERSDLVRTIVLTPTGLDSPRHAVSLRAELAVTVARPPTADSSADLWVALKDDEFQTRNMVAFEKLAYFMASPPGASGPSIDRIVGQIRRSVHPDVGELDPTGMYKTILLASPNPRDANHRVAFAMPVRVVQPISTVVV